MRASSGNGSVKANGGSGHSVSEIGTTDQMASDEWFAEIVQQLVPKDAGFALHILTGFEERTCYRYASGDRKPPAFFLRSLLRSEHGWVWLNAVMDGCNQIWWTELKRAKRGADAMRGD